MLVDRFLDDAIEIDVDALFDGEELYLGGVMEHIEEAGIHSGDSACVLPPVTLGREEVERVRDQTRRIAEGVGVRGLLNVQFALAADVLYVLEANPRASRTVPFVSKATGVPLAKAAARVMLGATIAELRAEGMLPGRRRRGERHRAASRAHVAVKEAVLPFKRFRTVEGRGVDHMLGPEMRSTGEVMGIDASFGTAFAKSQAAAYGGLPTKGAVFVSVANRDKRAMIFPVKRLADLGFEILATEGTAEVLRRNGVEATVVRKYSAGRGPDGEPTVVDRILAGEVDMVVNTPSGRDARADGYEIRAAAVAMDRPIITTVQELAAAVQGIEALGRGAAGRALAAGLDQRRVSSVSEGPLAGARRGAVAATGRCLPPHHAGGAGHRRARPGRASSWRWPSAASDTGMLLRRAFSIYKVSRRGVYGGTVEIVFAVHGAGTAWLAGLHPHAPVDVVGPLGRPFALPRETGQRDPGRRRLRQRPAVRPGRGAARARLPGRLRARRRERGPALRRARRQADGLDGRRHHRRRLHRDRAAWSPTCCPR